MPKVTHTTILHQPIEAVFAALTNFEHTPDWQPAVIKEWHTPAGPIQVGSQVHQIRTFRSQRVESSSVVQEFEPLRKMVNASDPANSPWVRTCYQLEPSDGNTRLTFSIELQGKGFFKLLSPLIQRSLKKDVVSRFENLEKYMAERASLS